MRQARIVHVPRRVIPEWTEATFREHDLPRLFRPDDDRGGTAFVAEVDEWLAAAAPGREREFDQGVFGLASAKFTIRFPAPDQAHAFVERREPRVCPEPGP